jgi:hypothetical protein
MMYRNEMLIKYHAKNELGNGTVALCSLNLITRDN